MIVTTSTRGQERLEEQAKIIASTLQIPYVRRKRHSVQGLLTSHNSKYMIMVGTDGVKCLFRDHVQEAFFFHPSSAMFRIKRLLKGEHDPFVDSSQLQPGMSLLDCTLGLASDSIVASYIVGAQGCVHGIESEQLIAILIEQGLHTWDAQIEAMNQSMRRIKVTCDDHHKFLLNCRSSSYDIVYFDPMFEKTNEQSTGIAPLKRLANYQNLLPQVIEEAKRVARKRVVLKESSYSSRFEELGFTPIERKYASHWFGTIEVG